MSEVQAEDAFEQAMPVNPEDDQPDPPTPGPEAPEADVLEQSIPVITEPDEDYR
jgi:hypothetical protein